MRNATVLVLSFVLSGGVFAATAPRAITKIDMASARTIALHVVPGKIVKEELEKEHGGSGLRYSFDILAKGVTNEVGVDARDGKVLENSIDDGKD